MTSACFRWKADEAVSVNLTGRPWGPAEVRTMIGIPYGPDTVVGRVARSLQYGVREGGEAGERVASSRIDPCRMQGSLRCDQMELFYGD